MKTLITCLIFTLLLAFSTNSKAQTFDNLLNCDVTISYEVWDASGCSNCSFGTITIQAGNQQNVSLCNPGNYDICITIIDIGGFSVPSNHTTLNACHIIPATGQSGTLPTSCGGGIWSVTHVPGNWTIQ